MFVLEGNLTFINIDQDYLKRLHDVCTEVYYKPRGYENKPYIGILINKAENMLFRYRPLKKNIKHGKMLIKNVI